MMSNFFWCVLNTIKESHKSLNNHQKERGILNKWMMLKEKNWNQPTGTMEGTNEVETLTVPVTSSSLSSVQCCAKIKVNFSTSGRQHFTS